MKILYVIDPTARQYGFPIRDNLTVRFYDKERILIGDKEDFEIFHEIMRSDIPFSIISGEGNFVCFGGGKIIGVKIADE